MSEADELVRVVDLPRPPGGMADLDVYEYATYRGEVWGDVHNVKDLATRVAATALALDAEKLRATENGHLVTTVRAPNTRYRQLPDGHLLYVAWATQYLLDVTQQYIRAFDLDDQIRVRMAEVADLPKTAGA